MEKDMRQIEELAGAGIATAELESKIQKLETVISRIVEQMNKTLLYQ
jgi:hypothetical protein